MQQTAQLCLENTQKLWNQQYPQQGSWHENGATDILEAAYLFFLQSYKLLA